MNCRAVIFDLDGTLLDSNESILNSLSIAVKTVLNVELDLMSVTIGPPLASMIDIMFPQLCAFSKTNIIKEFRSHYDAHGAFTAQVFDGVEKVLTKLKQSKVELFVVTNKPREIAVSILSSLGLLSYFRQVYSTAAYKPLTKSEVVAELLGKYSIQERAVLIGDSQDDFQAAVFNNLKFVYCKYGYGVLERRELHDAVVEIDTAQKILEVV